MNDSASLLLENLLQVRILEMEKAVQQQLAVEKANWAQERKA